MLISKLCLCMLCATVIRIVFVHKTFVNISCKNSTVFKLLNEDFLQQVKGYVYDVRCLMRYALSRMWQSACIFENKFLESFGF